jgi:hypothetical protein
MSSPFFLFFLSLLFSSFFLCSLRHAPATRPAVPATRSAAAMPPVPWPVAPRPVPTPRSASHVVVQLTEALAGCHRARVDHLADEDRAGEERGWPPVSADEREHGLTAGARPHRRASSPRESVGALTGAAPPSLSSTSRSSRHLCTRPRSRASGQAGGQVVGQAAGARACGRPWGGQTSSGVGRQVSSGKGRRCGEASSRERRGMRAAWGGVWGGRPRQPDRPGTTTEQQGELGTGQGRARGGPARRR